MSSVQWWQRSAADIRTAVVAGEASAEEVLESHIARLDAVNPAVNAVVVDLRDKAREEAKQADRDRAAGKDLPPLHGVPILTKINSDQGGEATSDGLPAMVGNVAAEDSPQIGNLRRAGAIVFGRTNAPEFSLRWVTDNPVFGATINPWNSAITPGGSSGGAGAAVAAGIAPLAHGNDLGGSLRYPAYCGGLVSLKATAGVIPEYCPTHGAEWGYAIKLFHVQGTISRTVEDAILSHSVMVQRDPRDPWWIPSLPDTGKGSKPKVGVCVDPGDFGVDPAVANAIDMAAEGLASQGYTVERVDNFPGVPDILRLWTQLVFTETALGMEAVERLGSPRAVEIIRSFVEAYGTLDLAGYIGAFAERTARVRDIDLFLEEYPIVLMPVSAEPPFRLEREPSNGSDMKDFIRMQRMQTVGNVTGLPALTVPVTVDQDRPIGVQLLGRRHQDRQVLGVGADLERALQFSIQQLWDRM